MFNADARETLIKRVSQYTKINESKLNKALINKPMSTIFEYPHSLNLKLIPAQVKKLEELKETLDLYNSVVMPSPERKSFKQPHSIAALLMEQLRYEKREHFIAILFNTKQEIISKEEISVGILNSALVHPREVFQKAISYNAASIIVVHNHPSGNPEPSKEDISLTARLTEAGGVLGIKVLDHIIIGDGTYFSLKEHMLMEGALDISISSVGETNMSFCKQDTYTIYQVKNGEQYRDFRFEGLHQMKKQGSPLDLNNYDKVYSGIFEESDTLDSLYTKFNIDHPADYTGRSLSISDIVVIENETESNNFSSAYYVDTFGFKNVTESIENLEKIRPKKLTLPGGKEKIHTSPLPLSGNANKIESRPRNVSKQR